MIQKQFSKLHLGVDTAMFDKSKIYAIVYEDLFSRKLWVHVTRRLSAAAVVKGFENAVTANNGHLPTNLISDRGLVLKK